jgi:hypothetical protein
MLARRVRTIAASSAAYQRNHSGECTVTRIRPAESRLRARRLNCGESGAVHLALLRRWRARLGSRWAIRPNAGPIFTRKTSSLRNPDLRVVSDDPPRTADGEHIGHRDPVCRQALYPLSGSPGVSRSGHL